MRFLEVLFLLGFFLVFVKAQGGTVGDEAFIEEEHDMAAGEAALEDEPEEEFKRQVIPPRPPMRRFVTVPLAIPPNANGRFFRLCYCFRRRCYVPGMYQGFRGWTRLYRSGYVVIGNWLYTFYLCRPGIVPPRPPRPTKRPMTKPPMTKPPPMTKG